MAEQMQTMDNQSLELPARQDMPRRRKFWLGYVFSIAGLVLAGLCAASFVLSIFSMVGQASGQRALMPGQAAFELEAGDYVINYDNESYINGRPFRSPPLLDKTALSCRLVNIETGQDMPLTSSSHKTTYSIRYNNEIYRGVQLFKATITQPGRYELHAGPLPGNDAGEPYVLAVSKAGFVRKLLIHILVLMAGMFLGVGGLAGLIVTIVLHSLHRKKCKADVRV